MMNELIPFKPPYPLVLVYGRDWSAEAGPILVDYNFRPYYAWVAGLLIQEHEDFICIAQDYCPETGKVREVWTIPKNTILKRYDFVAED